MTEMSIAQAAELLRRKQISPVDLTDACLARIEQLNPTINAFITVMHDSALTQAHKAEDEIHAGNWRGPLHGIPIGLQISASNFSEGRLLSFAHSFEQAT